MSDNTSSREAFERCILEFTGRDMEYHIGAETTGLECSWFVWQASEARMQAQNAELLKDAALAKAIRQLCNGSKFDLTDSPKSFVANVTRLVDERDDADIAAHQPKGDNLKGEEK